MEKYNYDVIVIGAGLSGLTAAHLLKQKDPDLRLLVLEAKDRVGGRTVTVPLKAANGTDYWDLGGQWVGRSQPHMMWLLDELELSTYRQYSKGKKFIQMGDNNVHVYSANIPSLSWFSMWDIHTILNKINKMAATVSVEDPWNCPQAQEWDSMTFETFKKKNLWTKATSETIDGANRTIFGKEASQISLLFFLTYVSGTGGIENLIEAGRLSGQELKIKGGLQQVSRKLAVSIGGQNIKLGEPVQSITQSSDDVTVTNAAGVKYHSQKVILAVPPAIFGKISFRPDLPSFKREVIRHMQPGSIIKIIITFQKAFWRENGFSGEILTNGGPSPLPGCSSGPLCIVFDATSPNGNPALVAFIGGYQAIQWTQGKSVDRQEAVLQQLSTFLGEEVFQFLQYVEKDWTVEPYTEGGPVFAMAPGGMQYFSRGLREPIDRIHFAGTETATVWCGFLNGAVQSGLRAAIEVLSDLQPLAVSKADLILLNMPVPNRFATQNSGFNLFKIAAVVTAAVAIVAGVIRFRHGWHCAQVSQVA